MTLLPSPRSARPVLAVLAPFLLAGLVAAPLSALEPEASPVDEVTAEEMTVVEGVAAEGLREEALRPEDPLSDPEAAPDEVPPVEVADLVTGGIPAGASHRVPLAVSASLTGLHVEALAPASVVAVLRSPDGAEYRLSRYDERLVLTVTGPRAGTWELEFRNQGTAPASVSYEVALMRVTASFGLEVSVGQPVLSLSTRPTTVGGALGGLDIQVRITDAAGAEVTGTLLERPDGLGYAADFAGLAPGRYVVVAWFEHAGTRYEAVAPARLVAAEDDPPLVAVSTSPAAPAASGWFTAATTVTIVATDAGSGVRGLSYRLNGGPIETAGSAASFDLPDGVTSVEYWAVDLQGNESVPATRVFAVDRVAPRIFVTTPADGAQLPVGEPFVVDFGCDDATSGVAECVGDLAGGDLLDTSRPGAYTFTIRATDEAGNETVRTLAYRVVGASTGPTGAPAVHRRLAMTGIDAGVLAALAALLVLGGGVVLVLRRAHSR